MTAARQLATEVTAAIRNLARLSNRAGNSAAAEAYAASADLIDKTFNIKGEPA